MEKIPEIVFTGGPCAGKTTGLSRVQSWLMDRGFRVFLVPEVATMFIQGGIQDIGDIASKHPDQYYHFQAQVLEMQMALRKHFRSLAAGFSEPSVIIYDRGPMDGCAYLDKSLFEEMLKKSGWSLGDVRDSFDAVIHLVTAANGAEDFYTLANNTARRETIDEARVLDWKTQKAWVGSPHVRVIGNDPPGFDLKMKRVIAAIARALGIPVPLEIERKFLLARIPDLSSIDGIQPTAIEQIYLEKVTDEQVRIRQRSAIDGSSLFYRTVKTKTGIKGVQDERESIISDREYEDLSRFQEPNTRKIKKARYCFIWHDQYFELDIFQDPPSVIELEIELTEINDKIEMPPFIDVDREVTGEPEFSNYELARL